MKLHPEYARRLAGQQELLNRPNRVDPLFYNGIYDRYQYPVLTREHIPLFWRYDLDQETNPYFQERLGVNAVMNSGAIELEGKFYLVARAIARQATQMVQVKRSSLFIISGLMLVLLMDWLLFWYDFLLSPSGRITGKPTVAPNRHNDGLFICYSGALITQKLNSLQNYK